MWAVIDKKSGEVTTLHLGGHTNRNQVSFENKFVSFVERLRIPGAEEVAEKNNAAEVPPAGQS
jgi:hypothetical protein